MALSELPSSAQSCGRPLEELDLREGEEVEIEVKKKGLFGLMKGWKVDPQALKDELRD
jgi:predicted DNA-binding antitoxin AbrB/MazE fold protein